MWNAGNQLVTYYNQAGSADPTIFAQYDYSGMNRVSKLVKTGTTYERTIYIDGIFEYCILENGTTYEKNEIHIMDDKSRIAMVRVGTPFPDDIADAVTYNLEDQIGSSSVRLNTYGTVIDREEYYPFGDSSLRTFSKKRYRYCGKERDEESGLYYYGARYYAAWTCRFISIDPLAHDYMHLTPYNYAGNKPISYYDIDGMQGNGEQKSATGITQSNTPQSQSTKGTEENKKFPVEIGNGPNVAGEGDDMGSGVYWSDFKESLNSKEWKNIQPYTKMGSEELFKKMYDLGNSFADGNKAKTMVKGLINHFKNGSGENYSSWDLTNAANKHPSTNRFKNDISSAFQSEMAQSGRFIGNNDFNLNKWLGEGHPRFNETGFLGWGTGDEDNGLRISVNDVWDYKIEVTSYKEIEGKYEAVIQLTLYDHFGLNPSDLNEHTYAHWYEGFYAWYTLQWFHGYKPFVTVMHIPKFTITGFVFKNSK